MKNLILSDIRVLAALLAFTPALAATFQGGAASDAAATKSPAPFDERAIDALFEQAWSAAGLKAAPLADDAEWLRRASVMLNGVIPSADDVAKFLEDHSQDKRAKKIDELVARSEFGEHWGGEWTRMMVGRGARNQRFDRNGFSNWVEEQFNKNVPFSEFTKSVIASSGRSDDNPAVGYIERWQAEPKDLAGQTAKVFLGVQIQCARCHDHKDQQWKKHEFNEFAAFFANTQVKQVSQDAGMRIFEVTETAEAKRSRGAGRFMKNAMEERAEKLKAKNPELAEKMMEKAELKFVPPSPLRPLEEGPLALSREGGDSGSPDIINNTDTSVDLRRREALAAWMTAPGNPYFSKSVVNSTFARMFGYALVNPSDDFRSDSTIAIPPLLDALAADFEKNGYNYKRLVTMLAKTKAFALSSAGENKEKSEARESHEKMFARYTMRPMTPEMLFDSITRATGIDELAEARAKTGPKGRVRKGQPSPEKMAESYGKLRQAAVRKFITTFEDDESEEEISFESTIPQALLLMNSRIINDSMSRGLTLQRVQERGNDKIDWLYMAMLSRKPTADERSKSSAYLQKNGGEKRETFEDLAWVLLNSAEFSTIH